MRRAALALVAWVLLVAPLPAAAAEMYSAQELAADRSRITSRIAEVQRRLTTYGALPADAAWLAEVPLVVEDLGPSGHPLGFASDGRRVYMPLIGLKFIEDLTMAYAWRYHQSRSLEPFDEYLAMLRYKPERDWPGGTLMDPLEAFGVPPFVWETNRAVGELGTGFRNEAWAFILAHELAHIYLRHPGNANLGAAASRANEEAADAFAFDLMNSVDAIPLGAILYFQATAVFGPNRADQPSDAAYARWRRQEATHPVNARRLSALASHLRAASRREADPARSEVLGFIAVRLAAIADALDNPTMQQVIVKLGLEGDPRRLKER